MTASGGLLTDGQDPVVRDTYRQLADRLKLTEADRQEMIPSATQRLARVGAEGGGRDKHAFSSTRGAGVPAIRIGAEGGTRTPTVLLTTSPSSWCVCQ